MLWNFERWWSYIWGDHFMKYCGSFVWRIFMYTRIELSCLQVKYWRQNFLSYCQVLGYVPLSVYSHFTEWCSGLIGSLEKYIFCHICIVTFYFHGFIRLYLSFIRIYVSLIGLYLFLTGLNLCLIGLYLCILGCICALLGCIYPWLGFISVSLSLSCIWKSCIDHGTVGNSLIGKIVSLTWNQATSKSLFRYLLSPCNKILSTVIWILLKNRHGLSR